MRFRVFFAAAAVLLALASAMPAPQDDEDKPMPVSDKSLDHILYNFPRRAIVACMNRSFDLLIPQRLGEGENFFCEGHEGLHCLPGCKSSHVFSKKKNREHSPASMK